MLFSWLFEMGFGYSYEVNGMKIVKGFCASIVRLFMAESFSNATWVLLFIVKSCSTLLSLSSPV